MASINASTSGAGGVITTADNTGTLQLQSAGTNIATISSTGLALNTGNITVAATAAPAFSAYCNAVQSIANNTETKLQFNVEQFDTNSNYNITNYRFTPTVAGYYQVSGGYGWQNVINGYGALLLYKNGANYVQLSFAAANGATNQYLAHNGGCLIYLNGSTDYIELYGYQVSGASQNTNGTNPIGSYFTASMARSA
jgi:hypothetical protein